MDLSHFNVQRVQVDDFPGKWQLGVNVPCSRLLEPETEPEPQPEPEPEPQPPPEPQRQYLIAILWNLWNGGSSQGDGEPVPAANGGESLFLSLYPDTILM